MGLFDFLKGDDEDQDTTQPTPDSEAATPAIPVDADGKPDVKAYIAQKSGLAGPPLDAAAPSAQYKEMANDDSDIEQARKSADDRKSKIGMIEGLAQILGGRQAGDEQFYGGLRNAADAGVKDAEQKKKEKLAGVLTNNKLQSDDPNAPNAVSARKILSKQLGLDDSALAGLSFNDQMAVAKQLKAAAGRGSSFQQANIEVPGKGTFKAVFDPGTGKYNLTPYHAGYKLGFDSTTGNMVSGADATAPATPVMTAGGVPLSDVRTQLGAQRAYANAAAGQQQKNDEAVNVDTAQQSHLDRVSKDLIDLYSNAKHETTFTGPFMGRVGEVVHKAGASTGPNSDKFDTESSREMLDYAHKTFGSRITEYDLNFINKVTPTIHDSPQMVKDKLDAFKDWARRKTLESRDVAGQNKTTQTQPPPSFPRTVRNAKGATATVSNAEELKEAQSEGFN